MSLTDEVKQLILSEDVDKVGIANVERFANAPEGKRPTDLLNGAKSVIVIGIGVGQGVAESNRKAYEESNRDAIYPYMLYGYNFLNNTLNTVAYKVMRFLEHRGFPTLPLPASPPNDSLKNMGAMSNRHAAVAAGIGEFGWQSLLMTPEFGPRIRVVSIVTTAKLTPSPLYSGEKLCDKEECKLACVRLCPMQAISEKESVSLVIEGREFSYAVIDKWRCKVGTVGLRKCTMGREDIEIPDEVTPENYLELRKKESPWQTMEMTSVGRASLCGKCINYCPVGK